MNKQFFLNELKNRLSGLPDSDKEERVSFYSEMIDDRVEDGLSEEEAVSQIGSVDSVVAQILQEYSLPAIVKQKVKPKRRLAVWEIVLIILGSPLWIPVLVAAVTLIASFYVILLCIVLAAWAVDASLLIAFPASVIFAVVAVLKGNVLAAVFSVGAGLICGGLSVLFFFASRSVTKAIFALTKKPVLAVKSKLVRGGRKQ